MVAMTNKAGFPVKQSVLTHGCVCLLSKGHFHYRPRRAGERKCKSVQGCIMGVSLSVLSLFSLWKKKKEGKDIPGLIDNTVPHHLGPKRASRIHRLFSLSKEDDIHKYAVRKSLNREGKKPGTKALSIQQSCYSTCPPTQMSAYCSEETAY